MTWSSAERIGVRRNAGMTQGRSSERGAAPLPSRPDPW